jgi:UDP-N-acetylmuramoyl-tripeptide--D-alanyl-D-alanine ligase
MARKPLPLYFSQFPRVYSAILVLRQMSNMKKFFVSFFLHYLRILAKIQLKKINPTIIGIGGASGKSSVAHLTEIILSKKYCVKQSKGKNSETGIPLNILDIELKSYDYMSWLKVSLVAIYRILTDFRKYEIYIVEMGIDSPFPPKNMSYLLSIIKPNISLLTNIALEHSMYFDELVEKKEIKNRKAELIKKIADQEKLLLMYPGPSGRVIINLDDDIIKSTSPIKAKTLTVSRIDKDADFYIKNIIIEQDLFQVEFKFLDENYIITLDKPLPKYFAYSIIFSLALAFSMGMSIRESIKIIQDNFFLPPGRFSLFKGIKGSLLIDSSYNSSLEACMGAMDAVKKIAGERRRIGILGDMRELGSVSKIQHELLAQEILKNLDLVVLFGEDMKKFVVPILEKNKFQYVFMNNFKDGKNYLQKLIKKNDVVLIKGSQNKLFLERAVELLLFDKKDAQFLCRRGKYWNSIRNKAS